MSTQADTLETILGELPGITVIDPCGWYTNRPNVEKSPADDFEVFITIDPLAGGWYSLEDIMVSVGGFELERSVVVEAVRSDQGIAFRIYGRASTGLELAALILEMSSGGPPDDGQDGGLCEDGAREN